MAYVIQPKLGDSCQTIVAALEAAIEKDGRFRASLSTRQKIRWIPDIRPRVSETVSQITISTIRLTKRKPYCGQHPGSCQVNPFVGQRKKPRMSYLEWDDWVRFHDLVNDVLDRLAADADVWTEPREPLDEGRLMWIRRGRLRRQQWDWEEETRAEFGFQPVRVWNHGSADQFDS